MKSDYIFINCPFDEEYFELLQPLLFTIIYLGKTPLISETIDSSKNRLEQIISLMEKAKYSVHDLSQIKGEKPRFNMPFELGIDICLQRSEQFRDKRMLILEIEKHSLKPIISDLGGNDTKHHNNVPKEVIKCIRDWFFSAIEKTETAYTEIWNYYNEFLEEFEAELASKGVPVPLTMDTIPLSELIDNMKKYVDEIKI
jgi:hypothetical protein